MSRKKSKQRQAVPEEILAEGSGPVGEPAEVEEAAAAEEIEAVKPGKKGRKAAKAEAPAEEVVAEESELADEVVESAVEVAPEEPKKARGKRGKKSVEADVEAADSDAESVSDADAEADSQSDADAGSDVVAADAEVATEPKSKKRSRRGKRAASDEVDAESDAPISADATNDAEVDATELAAEAADDLDELVTEGDVVASEDHSDLAFDASDVEAGADATMAASDADVPDSVGVASETPDGDDVVGEPITDEAGVEAALLPGTLSPVQLRHLIEALIFATDKPVTLQRLRQLTRVSDVARIEQALVELHEDYKDRGIALHQVSGGYQFRTNTAFSTWVQQLIQGRPVRLSRAQLETLAIVAYRQPITRPEIDEIRGVDSSATLRLLLDRSLIRVLGKKEEVGRPTLYGTTKEFLDFFSLGDLRELPTLREYSELTAESRQVMSDRLGVPLDANGEPIEGEGDEPMGDVDPDAEQAPQDQTSIVDSILAEHAAAEAEAEARHELGADLAEAALAGGSSVAMRDIFSDEPDPDAMMMSGEMSPLGSEARSYVDAIRAGALAESEPDDVEVHADAVGEAEAPNDVEAGAVEHESAPTDGEPNAEVPADVELHAEALSDIEASTTSHGVELEANTRVEREPDTTEIDAELRELAPNEPAAAASDDSEREPDEVVATAHHDHVELVSEHGERPHLVASDEAVAASFEANVVSTELAAESNVLAVTSDAVEVASEELLAASEDLAAVVADEVAAVPTEHPAVASDSEAGEEALELGADEPASANLEASASGEAVLEEQGEIELRVDEAQPHVGLTSEDPRVEHDVEHDGEHDVEHDVEHHVGHHVEHHDGESSVDHDGIAGSSDSDDSDAN